MHWRRQFEALICAVFILLAAVGMIALKTETTIDSYLGPDHFGSGELLKPTNKPGNPDARFEIESRWDKGSIWDDEATAYDLAASRH
jgi:hypothetical protein